MRINLTSAFLYPKFTRAKISKTTESAKHTSHFPLRSTSAISRSRRILRWRNLRFKSQSKFCRNYFWQPYECARTLHIHILAIATLSGNFQVFFFQVFRCFPFYNHSTFALLPYSAALSTLCFERKGVYVLLTDCQGQGKFFKKSPHLSGNVIRL